MKSARFLALLLSLALVLPFLSACASRGPSDTDTWLSARYAPYTRLVAFDPTNAFERAFNRRYARIVSKAAAYSDRLVREVRGACGKLDALEEKAFELLDRLADEDRITGAQAAALLQDAAARRASIDALLDRLSELEAQKDATDYERQMDALACAYLAESAGQQATDYVAALLDWVEFTPFLADASPPKAVTRQVDAIEGYVARNLDGRLETIAVYQRLLDSAVWWMEKALAARDAYCRAEAQTIYAWFAEWLEAYGGQEDAEPRIVAQVQQDLAWFQGILAAPVDGFAAAPAVVRFGTAGSGDGTQAAAKAAAVYAAETAFEQADALRYDRSILAPVDLVAAAQQTAEANGPAFLSDPVGYLKQRLLDIARFVGLAPSPTIARQVQALSEIPSSAEKLVADPNNTARVLEQVRKYQQEVKRLLKPDEWKSTWDKIKGLIAVSIDIDKVLDRMKDALKDKLEQRPDKAELERYIDSELRQSIKNTLGDDWQMYLLQLADADAQQIVDRFRTWFDRSKNKDTFQFTEEEVRTLLTSLLQRTSPAAHAARPDPGPLVLPFLGPTITPPLSPTPPPSVTPGVTPGTSPAATPGAISKEPFHLQFSIQEAPARVNGFMKPEEIMKILYGIDLSPVIAADRYGLGWYLDGSGTYRNYYVDERFEITVSTDATGQVWGLYAVRIDSMTDGFLTNVHLPAGHDLRDVNGRFFKVEFDNDGKLTFASDLMIHALAGPPLLWTYRCRAPLFFGVQGKASGRGREYHYKAGMPFEEYGIDGDVGYAKKYYDDGTMASSMEYKKMDPAVYMGGKYRLPDADAKLYDAATYQLYIADGSYLENDASGEAVWTGQFVEGIANGVAEHFWGQGRRDFSITLRDNVGNGPFVKGKIDFDTYYIQARGAYEDGKRSGRWEFYYYPGELGSIIDYVEGQPDGSIQAYYDNGNIRAESTIHDGKIAPVWTRYRYNGGVYKEEIPSRMEIYVHPLDEFSTSVLVEFPGESPYVSPP